MNVKQVKQETDPNKNYVYIINEKQDSIIPSSMLWIKVGMLQASTVGDSDFYGRIRALNQGNPRGLEVAYSVMTHSKSTAQAIESAVHTRLKAMGVISRVEETGEAGHGEWFATDIETVKVLIDEEYTKYLANQATLHNNFQVPAAKPVSKTRDKPVKPVLTVADPTLFEGG